MSDTSGTRDEGTVNRLSKRKIALVGSGVLISPNPHGAPGKHGNRNFWQAIKVACDGLREAWLGEPNLRLHVIIGVGVLICGAIAQLSRNEWLAITLAIGLVIVAELFNTAIEHTVDLIVGLRPDPLARHIKDVSAGSVLACAIMAVVIGCLVFAPHLTPLLR